MGLDKFKSEKPTERGEVTTRKKIENLNLTESTWRFLLSSCARPIPKYDYNSYSDSELKCIIQFIDNELETDAPFGVNSESSHIEKVEEFRQSLVDELKGR